MKLAQYLEETTGIVINPSSMFDIQVQILISCLSKLLPINALSCNFFIRTTDWIFLVEFLVMKNYLECHLLTWFSKISSPPKLSRWNGSTSTSVSCWTSCSLLPSTTVSSRTPRTRISSPGPSWWVRQFNHFEKYIIVKYFVYLVDFVYKVVFYFAKIIFV